jgi:hypothetical protein
MRFFFYILFFGLIAFIASKFLQLLISGKLFDEGAIKESFRESGKTLWLGMRLFVILWLLYLIFIWIVRQS